MCEPAAAASLLSGSWLHQAVEVTGSAMHGAAAEAKLITSALPVDVSVSEHPEWSWPCRFCICQDDVAGMVGMAHAQRVSITAPTWSTRIATQPAGAP